MSNYTRWYRDGTLSATNGSTAVTGSGTYWRSAGLNPGDMLEVNNSGLFYEIASVNSDTSITLARAYQGSTVTGAAYAIVRNFTATMPSKIAAQTAELLGDFRKYIDTDMDRITGRSAYEIAKLHGYVGTEAQWLASLKGNAEEISVINTKLDRIYTDNAAAHNGIFRGKNLGTSITAAQIAAIKAGTFDDLYLGDFWNLNINGINTQAIIAGFDTYMYYAPNTGGHVNKHHVVIWLSYSWQNPTWTYPINDTATCEGHIYNSKMFNEYLPEILSQINAHVSLENMVYMYDTVADAINSSGAVSHRVAVEKNRIFLPSAYNLLGNFYDSAHIGWNYAGMEHFPLFRLAPWGHYGIGNVWTSENANATQWKCFHNHGRFTASRAANEVSQFTPVKPFILLGEAQS